MNSLCCGRSIRKNRREGDPLEKEGSLDNRREACKFIGMDAISTAPLISEIRDTLSRSTDDLKASGIRKLAVFGSAVHGDFTEESDLDVLVEFAPGRTPGLAFFEIQEKLGQILRRKVDLNTPGFLSRHFRDAVLEEAEVVYEQA